MAPPAASAITMALATPSSSVDISAGVGDVKMGSAGLTAAAKPTLGLPPTPPNSYSPSMPAHAVRKGLASPPPVSLDRDIDLQDAVEHARAQDQPNLPSVPLSKEALSGLEREQVITPALLARDYLPSIMLGHGDMAIRQIMACLNHDVSGFSKIEPARARRTVVAALEGRAGGGRDGKIQFVKVGWGRWLAHIKGQGPSARPISSSARANRLSPAASDSSFAASYSGTSYPAAKRLANGGRGLILGQSYTGSDMPSLDEGLEDMSMSDHEIDNMSIDGGNSSDSSDSAGDETDEEDWAAIGAAALRRRASKPTIPIGGVRRNYNLLCIPGPVNKRRLSATSSSARASASRIASSAPADRSRSGQYLSTTTFNKHSADAMDIDYQTQEREAARALLSLGSM